MEIAVEIGKCQNFLRQNERRDGGSPDNFQAQESNKRHRRIGLSESLPVLPRASKTRRPSQSTRKDRNALRSVEYDAGFGLLGQLAQKLFIAPGLRQTFEYRQKMLEKLLG